MKKTIIRLAVTKDCEILFYHYCKICSVGIEHSSLGNILYDWERDVNHENKAVFKLTFDSIKQVVNFFLQLGRIIGINEPQENLEFLEK